jgi:hypothetical protein
MTVDLGPTPRRRVRIGIVGALWLLALISSVGWLTKLAFCLTTVVWFGTWRRYGVTDRSLIQQWTVGFIQLSTIRTSHRKFEFVEVVHQGQVGVWEFVLFGPFSFVYGFISEWLFPWLTGSYQLWLNNSSDERVLAWQGNSQEQFETNLAALQSATGLRISAR